MVIQKIFAQAQVHDIVGDIENQALPDAYKNIVGGSGSPGAITLFITNIIRIVFVAAGIYAFFNLILAGWQYMSAAGDTKALNAAWARIWQSLLGLVIIVGSFALAAVFGQLIFGNAGFILNPQIYGP